VALGDALVATALEAVGRFVWSGPYLPELAAQKLFALIPLWAFTPLFRIFGYDSKYYAFAGMITLEVAGLTLVGAVLRGWLRTRRRATGGRLGVDALAAACVLAALILVGLLPLLDAGVAGQGLAGGARLAIPSIVGVVACYVAVLTRGV
jgi:hypothetical protein